MDKTVSGEVRKYFVPLLFQRLAIVSADEIRGLHADRERRNDELFSRRDTASALAKNGLSRNFRARWSNEMTTKT
jgi:hypothetical protein